MEEVYENEYIINKKLIKEYVYNVLCKRIILLGCVIFVLGLIMFFININKNGTSYTMLTAAFIAGITALFSPIITTKQIEENEKRLNNGKIEKTYIKFSNNIVMHEGKVHLEFEYSQIKRIIETKNFIVLKTSNQTAILVFKTGFTVGEKESFLEFINRKITS